MDTPLLQSLPAFNLTSVPANKMSRLITDREANAPFFTEILKLLVRCLEARARSCCYPGRNSVCRGACIAA